MLNSGNCAYIFCRKLAKAYERRAATRIFSQFFDPR